MFKTLTTLFKGSAAAAAEELADRNALLILDQQIRVAVARLGEAKRALAVAIAQDKTEGTRLEGTEARIADLEERATAALSEGREDLAEEAAEAIATLEADRDAAKVARATFAKEIARLREGVTKAQARISELDRGRRVARAAEAVRTLRSSQSGTTAGGDAALIDAEKTLDRLRQQQAEAEDADQALAEMDAEQGPEGIADRLEAEGFGPKTKTKAADVLERLKNKAGTNTPGKTD